ncbi:hypothetical protein OIU77_023722 [Salix suchowensis]|uniref:Uncharacterized protein n=1 Tax=Salix suchowensis TaxID=1278906 RepID=A0ABQ9C861_9ROSI|nr:hypothetical protein OIU77_023722 [Salix suchowensis]
MEKSFKVTESPVRSAKFIARKHWIVTGSDDKFIRKIPESLQVHHLIPPRRFGILALLLLLLH